MKDIDRLYRYKSLLTSRHAVASEELMATLGISIATLKRDMARLREVLIDAAGDPDAGEALLRFFGTTRFLPLDDASQQALDRIAAGVSRVRAEVE